MITLSSSNTDNLQQALMDTPDLERFLQEHNGAFKSRSLEPLLSRMLREKNISRAELAKRAGMSEVYLYQLSTGRRFPSRSRMLCLCLGLGATVEETQRLLQQCGFAALYPAIRRDAIILHGILHGHDLFQINDDLFAANEETLY